MKEKNYVASVRQDSNDNCDAPFKDNNSIEQSDLPDITEGFDDDDDSFEPCSNCDLPDACEDFGCAIKNGVRKDYPIDGVF
jgi:hypothetical protein